MATPMKNATSSKDFDSLENLTDLDEIKNAYTGLCKEEVMIHLNNDQFLSCLILFLAEIAVLLRIFIPLPLLKHRSYLSFHIAAPSFEYYVQLRCQC